MAKPEKIEDLSLTKVSNAALNFLASRVVDKLLSEPAIEEGLGRELQEKQLAFQAAIGKKSYRVGLSLKSVDKMVDRIWYCTKTQLKINKDNPDPEVSHAASRIWPVFASTPDPRKLKHKEEYGAIGALLPKLEAFGEEMLAKAYILSWVKGMRDAYKAFCDIDAEKVVRKASIEIGLNRKLREELIDCYESIIDKLNAIQILHPDEDHAKLNAHINQIIADFRLSDKLGQRKDNEEGEPEAETEEPAEE